MFAFIRSCPLSLFIGAFMVIINFPLGWIGLAYFVRLAKRTENKAFYFSGVGLYVFSWILFFAGIYICGKDYASELFSRYHMPIIAFTVLTITIILARSFFFSKKPSKINAKVA
jgi:hypothetical protein